MTTISYAAAIKKNSEGTNVWWWWLRSAISNSDRLFYTVDYITGEWDYSLANYTRGVSPAFRIG